MSGTQEKHNMENKTNCPQCSGTGVYAAGNGPDDYTMEMCDCPAGEVITTFDGEKTTKGQFAEEMKAEVAHHD